MKNKILLSILCIVVVMTTIFCLPASAAGDDGLIDFKFNEISLSYYTLRTPSGGVIESTATNGDKSINIKSDSLINYGDDRFIVFSGALDLPSLPAKSNVQLSFGIQLSSNVTSRQNGGVDTYWVGRTSELNGGSVIQSGSASFSGTQFITYTIPMTPIESGSYYFGFNIPFEYSSISTGTDYVTISFVNLSITTQDGHVYGKNEDFEDSVNELDKIESDAELEIAPGLADGMQMFDFTFSEIMGSDGYITQGLIGVTQLFKIMLNRFNGVFPVWETLLTFGLIIGLWAFLLNVVPSAISFVKNRSNSKGGKG